MPQAFPRRGFARFGVLFVVFFLFGLKTAWAAASLYVAPPSGTFTLNSTFSVSIYVNTGGQFINAVDAKLMFPPDKLQVISPTTGKSIIQVWVAQPIYSNSEGTLRFQGAVPNPGIETDSGLVSTVTFRVKSLGTAALKFDNDSHVLLNDGRGTDILGQTTDGIYYLSLPPQGLIVTSRTNPDQNKWYGTDMVSFEWTAPPDIQGYSYVLDQNPQGEPDETSEGVNTRITYRNLADGTYYFHIKGLCQGIWGGVTDYVVNIDNTPPAAFNVNISPSDYTSNQRPIIDFGTTDAASGIDHYELKIISLDLPAAKVGQNETPFFIEVTPPYSPKLDYGSYNVVVRAYDAAGNYYQAERRLNITQTFFEIISDRGLRLGSVVFGWPTTVVLFLTVLALLGYLADRFWKWHLAVEAELRAGVSKHPSLIDKLVHLRSKQKEYGHGGGFAATGLVVALAFIFGLFAFGYGLGHSQGVSATMPTANPSAGSNVSVEPPVVTLFPKAISNDEILYIGGRSGAPQSQVIVYLQSLDTGSTLSQIVVTEKDGSWFYSFPQFLNAGHYLVWTQLKVQDVTSPPSPQLDLTVAPAAIQIGGNRLSYQDFYLLLTVIFFVAFAALLAFTLYHGYHFRQKSRELAVAIAAAEESIRRGFAVIKRDIESELEVIRKAKLSKELSVEKKFREDKLLKDLDAVNRYVGREIWEVDEAEKKL